MQQNIGIRLVALFAVAAGVGLACIIVPPFLLADGIHRNYTAPLFPMLRTAWENLALAPTVFALVSLGLVLGAIQPRFWYVLGGSPVALLPIAAAMEMIVSPTSHNLWPLELLLYSIMGLPSFLGAFVGSRLRLWFRTRHAA